MLDILDIRTLSFTTMLFSFIYGVGLVVYSVNHRKFVGISMIGIAFLVLSLGLSLIAIRHFVNDFVSVVIANILNLVAIMLVHEGLVRFRQAELAWGKYIAVFMLVGMALSFYYFTYYKPDVNARIIIIASCFSVQFFLTSYALFYRTKQPIGTANTFLATLFLLLSVFYACRSILTLGESELYDFMGAGLIHAIALINIQAMVLFAGFSVVWIASSELEKELIEQARIDPLTLVYNRRALEDVANTEISRVIRNKLPLSIIMCDIDHFKIFNDEHGHLVGDKVLVDFCSILKANLREHDFVARYGGEEFLVLLPETDLQQAVVIANKLRVKICQHRMAVSRNRTLSVTASFGVAAYQKGMTDWRLIVKAADQALYQAKNNGRNKVMAEEINCEEE